MTVNVVCVAQMIIKKDNNLKSVLTSNVLVNHPSIRVFLEIEMKSCCRKSIMKTVPHRVHVHESCRFIHCDNFTNYSVLRIVRSNMDAVFRKETLVLNVFESWFFRSVRSTLQISPPLCCCVEAEMFEISRPEPIKQKIECESSYLTMKIVVLT